MSDAEKKPEEGDKPKKKSKALFAIIGVVVLIGGSAGAGIFLAPQLGGRAHAADKSSKHGDSEEKDDEKKEDEEEEGHSGGKEEKVGPAVTIEPMVVDLRDAQGEAHHLKMGFALELTKEVPEEEGKTLTFRARDAALSYMRGLKYEDVTSTEKFEVVRNEAAARIKKAYGKKLVRKVLLTDYVVQ